MGARLRPQVIDLALVDRCLPPEAGELFRVMPRYDQRHALEVLRTLQAHGYDDRDLLAAALLHDAAKSAGPRARVRLWHRVAFVLRHHPELSARLALEAGCSPRTAELIRHHEGQPDECDDPLLAALRAADEAN